MKMERVKKRVEQVIAQIAKRSASVEANTACSFLGYQPKEPKQVKSLRKF
ncbi:MAG: cyclic lactone autoinducer peptide [Lachnospiraceae bacterium]|nr:cyclic lactone autoinducer peptide [Lachnospiraceae bacterium]